VIRRMVSVLMVTAMLLATMVSPAFADSVRGCNNRCGDTDLSTNNSTNNTTNSTTNTTNNNTVNCNVKDACK
jgi:hypothetical protein